MIESIYIEGSNSLISTRTIARECKVAHVAAVNLVKKYIDELNEDDGGHEVELRQFKTAGRYGEEAILNEEQTILLISLMRNSRHIVAIKLEIVKCICGLLKYESLGEYKSPSIALKIHFNRITNG